MDDARFDTGRNTLRGGALLLAALLLATLACTGSEGRDRSRPGQRGGGPGGSDGSGPPPVEAVQARRGALPLQETLSGVVRAYNQVAIRPEIEAPIVEVMVRSGEAVTAGQALVRLEDDRLREQLRQAEADVSLARASAAEARARVAELEAQVGRTRRLAEEDLVPEMDLETLEARVDASDAQADQAQARVEQAQATLEERRNALSKTIVRAPVSGRIGRRNAEVGMLANPSATLFRIGDFDELIVEVPLTEGMLDYIDEGTPVRIRTDDRNGPAEPIRAELSRISPFLEQGSFSTTGEIDVRNGAGAADRLRPGKFVTVDVLYGQSERATLVPAAALWEDPRTGAEGIFVVEGQLPAAATDDGNRAKLSEGWRTEEPRGVEFRPVEVLAEGRGMLGIRGAEAGEWVVTVGQHLLSTDSATDEPLTARVRPTTWESVLELQGLQREDLLHDFLDKQRRLARAIGVELPATDEDVDRLLEPDGAPTALAATRTAGAEG
ncbi:MAG: efflux RND transporter periplasmic adaptor subunit [Acidobacteriota bacterium]|jgi:RND family efflux transporter MFP subunit